MVVRTDLCHFTEYKIYPGHGQRFVGRDAKITFFITQKVERLYHQKVRAVKLTWTSSWRRMNKKGKVEAAGKKKGKKTTKFQKAIVGMSVEAMNARKAQRTQFRAAAKETAVKEAKSRATKRGGNAPGSAGQKNKNMPKQGKAMGGAMKQKNFKK